MVTYIKINEELYPVLDIKEDVSDPIWEYRETKIITIKMDYAKAASLFVNETPWSIVEETKTFNVENYEEFSTTTVETNCNDYCIAGPIIDHRNGFLTIRMGKYLAKELLAMFEEVL